jgi:hypothetical protein
MFQLAAKNRIGPWEYAEREVMPLCGSFHSKADQGIRKVMPKISVGRMVSRMMYRFFHPKQDTEEYNNMKSI